MTTHQRFASLLIATIIFLSGCATFTSPKDIRAPEKRTIACTITAQSQKDLDRLEAFIAEANVDMEKIFGCRLEPRSKFVSPWPYNPDYQVSLKTMHEALPRDEDEIVVAYHPRPIQESVMRLVLPVYLTWEACIDDIWRRLIILKTLDSWLLMHEFGHAVILDREHSSYGLMGAVSVGLLPGLPPARSWHVSDAEVREIEKNRWRDFRENIERFIAHEKKQGDLVHPAAFGDPGNVHGIAVSGLQSSTGE